MKFQIIDNNKYIIIVKKERIKEFDWHIKSQLEKYLKNIFLKINKIYNINLKGYFDVNVYVDKYYGIVIEVMKECIDYYENFNNIDLQINVIDKDFLYEVEDISILKSFFNSLKIYSYNGKYIVQIKKELDKLSKYILLENSKIIYNTEKIPKHKLVIDKIK